MTPQSVTDLRDFLKLLEERGELRRIAVEVDPVEEIAAVTDRVCKTVGPRPALLFENVQGHDIPVATNLFGSLKRAAWAVGLEEPEELRSRFADELKKFDGGLASDWLFWSMAEEQWQPRRMAAGACQEVVLSDPDLGRLPALKSWPGDGGRFLTQPLVFTSDPKTGQSNCGMYRVRILDSRSAILHWLPGSGGARHYAAWQLLEKPMPVSIVLGGDPAAIFAAGVSLPEGVEELSLAGFLRGRSLETVTCLTNDLEVPARAEFVIEGVIYPGETSLEGGFGNHTGIYDHAKPAPVLRITSLSHRQNPLYPAIVTGPPPMESGYLAKLGEKLTLALLQYDFPDIVDINQPCDTIFHGATLLSSNRQTPAGFSELVHRLWAKGPLEKSKLLVVFDAETDVQDFKTCFWKAVNRFSAEKGILVDQGRLAIDATGLGDRPVVSGRSMLDLLAQRWREYGIDPA
ncbi:MAG: UbiD family decarboxylase [Syntrophotaleaceae bacterium]